MVPPYSFAWTDAALQALAGLPPKLRRQVAEKIERLATEPKPSGCKLIRGMDDEGDPVYRIRQGDYRVLYVVREPIKVLDIGHRKDIYE